MSQDIHKLNESLPLNRAVLATIVNPTGGFASVEPPNVEVTSTGTEFFRYIDRFDDRVYYSSSGLPD